MKDEKIKNDSSLVRKKEIDAGPRFVTRFFGIFDFQRWSYLHKCFGEEMPPEGKVWECFYIVRRCLKVFRVDTLIRFKEILRVS
jgi:hypothetical protein